MKYLLLALKILLGLFLVLFAGATALAGSYLQTLSLLLLVVSLFFWPFFSRSSGWRTPSRFGFAFLILILQITAFKPTPKTSIYKSEPLRKKVYAQYEQQLRNWPSDTEHLYLNTDYGRVHVLACGDPQLPPILLFHAASMSAHSWAETLPALEGKYRIYAVDHPGEGNLSELNNALEFPLNSGEIAQLYADIADELEIERSPVIGASNGGYVAQVYALNYPERVESLILMAPMGLTKLSNNSLFMLAVGSLYPLEGIRQSVVHWALGSDDYVHQAYGDWFDLIVRGTIPSVAQPEAIDSEAKAQMQMPILLFLATRDPLVGEVERASNLAGQYPDIEIEVMESGHIIGVERKDEVNQRLTAFLSTARDP